LRSRVWGSNGAATYDQSVTRSGDVLRAGTRRYEFDGLGRTIRKDDLALTYNAAGHVREASRGAARWSFLYDEAGTRIAKLAGGVVVAMYPEDGSLVDAEGLVEPVEVEGFVVGLLRHRTTGVELRLIATDVRGTALADGQWRASFATPFGDRTTHATEAAALDYAAKGWDADLGVVRMGVRDYDPELARFWTPDPLFLEQLDQSVASPVEAGLYGYALNDPLTHADADGMQVPPNRMRGGGPIILPELRRPRPSWGVSARLTIQFRNLRFPVEIVARPNFDPARDLPRIEPVRIEARGRPGGAYIVAPYNEQPLMGTFAGNMSDGRSKTQAHHPMMKAWLDANGLSSARAPTVTFETTKHQDFNTMFSTYVMPGLAKIQGSNKVNWKLVDEPTMKLFAEASFDWDKTPQKVRDEFWSQWKLFKAQEALRSEYGRYQEDLANWHVANDGEIKPYNPPRADE
jgi:RHS repeat-associated protein